MPVEDSVTGDSSQFNKSLLIGNQTFAKHMLRFTNMSSNSNCYNVNCHVILSEEKE